MRSSLLALALAAAARLLSPPDTPAGDVPPKDVKADAPRPTRMS